MNATVGNFQLGDSRGGGPCLDLRTNVVETCDNCCGIRASNPIAELGLKNYKGNCREGQCGSGPKTPSQMEAEGLDQKNNWTDCLSIPYEEQIAQAEAAAVAAADEAERARQAGDAAASAIADAAAAEAEETSIRAGRETACLNYCICLDYCDEYANPCSSCDTNELVLCQAGSDRGASWGPDCRSYSGMGG